MKDGNNSDRSGFTVLQVLFMTVTVALLAHIFLPRVTTCKTSATRIGCVNNLKEIGLAVRIPSTNGLPTEGLQHY